MNSPLEPREVRLRGLAGCARALRATANPALPLLLVCVLAAGCAPPPFRSQQDALATMVQTEMAFAQVAARAGTRAAFLRFLSDDGLLFGPQPVNGRQFWEGQPAARDTLTWQPSYAQIAESGDYGFVTGPYEWRFGRPGAAPERGVYVNVWRRQGERWRLAAGMAVPEGPVPNPPARRWRPPTRFNTAIAPIGSNRGPLRRNLLAADSVFGEWAGRQGLAVALDRFAADSVRLLRPRTIPVENLSDARAHPAAALPQPSFAEDAEVSRAGDFGWVRGRFYVPRPSGGYQTSGSYLRIWRRPFRGDWKLLLDVTTEARPEREE